MSDTADVLYVDGDEEVRRAVQSHTAADDSSLTVRAVDDSAAALAALTDARPDCIVTEYDLPSDDGLSLYDRLREAGYDGPVLLFTARPPADIAREAFALGVDDFVQKSPGAESYDFLFDKVRGVVAGDETVRYGSGGSKRDVDTLVALGAAPDTSHWTAGSLPDLLPEVSSPEAVQDAIASVLENDGTFRTHLAREADTDLTDPRVWRLTRGDGALEHRRVSLPTGDSLDLFRDISEECERRERLERFERLLDTAQDGLYALDANGHYTYVNETMAETLGYDREEMLGMHAGRILGQGEYERGQSRVQDLVADAERESEVIEFSVERADGSEFPVAIHFAPLYDATGTYDGLVGVMRDISERKARERRRRESERRYRTLAENIPNGGVGLFDEELRYTLVAGELFDVLDLGTEDFEGSRLADVHTDAYVETFGPRYEAVFDGDRSSFEFSHADGYYRTNLVPVRDDAGDIEAGLNLTMDITAQREYEQELERQNERLRQFASIVSHDLRNPLNVIEGRLQLYRERGDGEHLDIVEKNVDRMNTLIEDLLELARQGRSVGEMEAVDLDTLVDQCWEGVETADATLVTADLETVAADAARLRQLLTNLFRNAVEHGSTSSRSQTDDAVEHAGESVTVRVGGLTDESGDASGFYVEDDGPGIPADRHEDVLEYGVTDSDDGTGIGLAIVSEIAEAHGWSVAVTESESGGARFEITGVDRL